MNARIPPVTAPLGMLVKVFPKLSETFVLEEVLGLERQGVHLRLYTLAPPSDGMVHAAAAQVRASIVQVPSTPWRSAPGQTAKRHLQSLLAAPLRYLGAAIFAASQGQGGLANFFRAGWLAGQMREDRVTHLHAHFISQPADVAELLSRLSGLPFSISAHAKDIYLSARNDLERKLRRARFTVTCTDFNRQTLQAIAPGVVVHRMYHGINHGVFYPGARRKPGLVPLLVSVGRLRAKKGLDTLIEACRLLRDRGQPFRCQIVGYGEEQQRLQYQVQRHDLAEQVELVGKLTREQVVERYAAATVYVQPSRVMADGDRDGIPNVLLEAMAMALPVVATRVSGIPELVQDGHNGLLVEADDPQALADAISRLIDAPELGARLGQAARVSVLRDFDNDRNLRLLLQQLSLGHDHTEPAHERAAA